MNGVHSGRGPRRLVFLTTGLSTGGAEMMLLKLCAGLDRDRYHPSVISLSDMGAIGPRIESLGIPVHALGFRPGRASFSGWMQLRKLIGRLQPELVQGWMYHGNLAACMAAGGRPMVWGVRQSLYGLANERPLTRWVIRANALLSARARAIVYNSHISARQHEAFGFKAPLTHIIPNGFDIDLFTVDANARRLIRQELGVSDTTMLIGLIARYHPMKDHAVFLDAAAALIRECPTARFLLAGTGVDVGNTALTATIRRRGLGEHVFLLGERKDIRQVQAALDIASSTSSWGEGFANVVGEAMSCGVPCVVTDVGDSAWIVGTTGSVVPRRDPHALARAWRALIESGRERRQALGMQARERVIAKFSVGTVVRKYEDLYERVIARVKS